MKRKIIKIFKQVKKKIPFLHHQPPFSLPYRNAVLLAIKRPVNLGKIENVIRTYSTEDLNKTVHDLTISINYLRKRRLNRKDASNLSVAAVRAICSVNPEMGIAFGRSIFLEYPDERGLRTLVSVLWRSKQPIEALELLKMMSSTDWKASQMEKIVSWVSRQKRIDENYGLKVDPYQRKVNTSNSKIPNRLQFSGTTDLKDIRKLTVACILDDFSYNSFKYEANFIQLSVDDYIIELETAKPDLLFIESAWRGKDGRWDSKVGHASEEVLEILGWCENNQIPTAFWNKEDPVHFNSFLNVAKLFQYVFSTDIDCLHRYKSALGHDRVYLLPFAFQPKISNPLEKYSRKNATCFAGAYYKKYPERTRDLNELINAISKVSTIEIYDRNYNVDLPEYQFPIEFNDYIIGTLPFEKIDVAYKGYDSGLNLNTIKQSQSMFARRVFELVASNTLVISNYSRGVRNFFGDCVISSDNGSQIISSISDFKKNGTKNKKIKLIALRNVFSSHTYQHRFTYIISKMSDGIEINSKPQIIVLALAKNNSQAENVIESFKIQSPIMAKMVLFTESSNLDLNIPLPNNIELVNINDYANSELEEFLNGEKYFTVFSHEDHYGVNYLNDLYLSTIYTDCKIITKDTYFMFSESRGLTLEDKSSRYKIVDKWKLKKSLIQTSLGRSFKISQIIEGNLGKVLENETALSIDEFNYCMNGNSLKYSDLESVSDLINYNSGLDYNETIKSSESVTPDVETSNGKYISSARMFQELEHIEVEGVDINFIDTKMTIESTLDDGKHVYLYWPELLKPKDIGFVNGVGRFHFDTTPGLRLMLAIVFTDKFGKKIDSDLSLSNSNIEVSLPSPDCFIKLGIRVYSSGFSKIHSLDMFHHDLSPQKILGHSKHLILTNHYPSYEEIYRNGFIHSRVRDYNKRGVKPDIFKIRTGEKIKYSEFEGVDVISGSAKALSRLLDSNNYSNILIHFLDKEMWDVVESYSEKLNIYVWVHGSEIQPWHRRTFNYTNESELANAKVQSKKRMNFWKPLLKSLPKKMKLIFVSEYFAKEVMEDTGITLDTSQYEIIHNPIDTEKFNYIEKEVEKRKKILSIRPYASRKYANDLSVKAVLEISKRKEFSDMEFLMVGAGKLFEETLAPLRVFDNVTIQEGFLTHSEIANLHKEYGIFLTPTRMDSQGVSRDEAMSSGLVPVTNSVTAIPEFVDNECGILAEGENYKQMAMGILELYNDPKRFKLLSLGSSTRVRRQSSTEMIITKEIELFAKTSAGD